MYSRVLNGEERTFGVSGKLWNGVLVMYDAESDSLWTQIDGRAIQGEATGTRLEHVESFFTTWKEWVNAHPDTEVLARAVDAEPIHESRYAEYLEDPERLFLPELSEGLGGIEPKDLVFGVTVAGESWAVTEGVLARDELVQAVVGGTFIAIAFDPQSRTARAFVSELDGHPRLLQVLPRTSPFVVVRDAATGETFDPGSLPSLRLDRAYWYAWSRSHRGSRILAD